MKKLVRVTAVTSITALMLSACSQPDGSLGDNARTGAVAGAILGGLVGTTSGAGGKPKNVILGAAVGAAAGAALGNELDKQEADLRDRISDSGATITNTGSELIVTLPEAITFDTDSTFVRSATRGHLAELAQSLQNYPNSSVDVVGHTDNVGDASYNQNLSLRRAQAVYQVLIDNNVDPLRVRPFGRGENDPIASNDTSDGRQQNRRVTVVITPQA